MTQYLYVPLAEKENILNSIRNREVDCIISLAENNTLKPMREIIELSRIYGIAFFYPKLIR